MYITESDVRVYLRDRSAEDHVSRIDVMFTPTEIAQAMRTAARRYNSIKPYVDYVNPDKLPGRTNLFLDGIAAALYEGLMANAAVNDIDYSAGNMSANVQGNLLKNAQMLAQFYGERFMKDATDLKLARNLQRAFGRIG